MSEAVRTEVARTRIPEILRKYEGAVLNDWMRHLQAATGPRASMIREGELRTQCSRFLAELCAAVQYGDLSDLAGPAFQGLRDMLADLSRARAQQGFTPSETAVFVFSLKLPLFALLRTEYASDAAGLAAETWTATLLLDSLGLHTMEVFQKSREAVIVRQQQELLELSTPVVKLWDGVLALPLIGTLDSDRTQVVMENLLNQIVATGAEIAIIDITGVPTVDTLVAQHLLKTVAAARLMGADCIISGIRPQIAQTIVHLGVELGNVITKASLAEAFRIALAKSGQSVVRA